MSTSTIGEEIEDWVKNLTSRAGILKTGHFPLEKVVGLLNERLSLNMQFAKLYIDEYFPYGKEWIERISSGQCLSARSSLQARAALSDKLLDLALATDLVVAIKDNKGIERLIAIDITSNPTTESAKFHKIQGKRDDRDPHKFNRNSNLPSVRRALGIDKHCVLVVNSQCLPDPESVLASLHALANSQTATRSINLYREKENALTPKQLWEKYVSVAVPLKEGPVALQVEVAALAFQEGLPLDKVKAIVQADPHSQKMRESIGHHSWQRQIESVVIAARARERDGGVLSAAIQNLLAHRGQEVAGGREAYSKNGYRFCQIDEILAIESEDRHIFRFEAGKVTYNPKPQDKATLSALVSEFGLTKQKQSGLEK